MKNKLALFGGERTIEKPFKPYNPIDSEEVDAAAKVVKSGVLSKFVASSGADFCGGPKVQEFERACEKFFNVRHAVTVNSWTSGLIAAVGAVDIEPGDEIITTTWTMCATATAILHWNAIPVFADVDRDTFNICPKSVEKNITPYTKAILAVDIFGQSCDILELSKIAKKYKLKLITDTAQAPGTIYNNKPTGTLADVGGFSLNYHKHIHTGEGGVIVTNDSKINEKLQLIRNHGEAVVKDKGVTTINNIVGYNFRLGEMESAIGIEQLKKLPKFIKSKQEIASELNIGLIQLKGLQIPVVNSDCSHAYYVYPLILDLNKLGVSRSEIVKALIAEGVEGLMEGYANIHMLPMYQEKIAYGSNGFPWTSDICKRKVDYSHGICPVAEELHEHSFLGYEMCLHELGEVEVELIIQAFQKVWANLEKLR